MLVSVIVVQVVGTGVHGIRGVHGVFCGVEDHPLWETRMGKWDVREVGSGGEEGKKGVALPGRARVRSRL